jgi:hypothetical protein
MKENQNHMDVNDRSLFEVFFLNNLFFLFISFLIWGVTHGSVVLLPIDFVGVFFCNSYWNYIENMIFDLDINEPDQQKFNKQPKNVYSYIKSQKKRKQQNSTSQKWRSLTCRSNRKKQYLK